MGPRGGEGARGACLSTLGALSAVYALRASYEGKGPLVGAGQSLSCQPAACHCAGPLFSAFLVQYSWEAQHTCMHAHSCGIDVLKLFTAAECRPLWERARGGMVFLCTAAERHMPNEQASRGRGQTGKAARGLIFREAWGGPLQGGMHAFRMRSCRSTASSARQERAGQEKAGKYTTIAAARHQSGLR